MSWFGEIDKVRKSDWPVWDYIFGYFPLALLEEVKVAVIGNKQHNPGQKLHWAREKSTDQLNTAMRHLFDYHKAKSEGAYGPCPRDATGKALLAQAIWRLKAQLQLDREAEDALAVPEFEALLTPKIPDGVIDVTGLTMNPDFAQDAHRCSCGAKTFYYNAQRDLPPTVVYPGDGTHSPNGCKRDVR